MEITFTKTGYRNYSVLVRRDDKVLLSVPDYDRPFALPHDLAHYIIEKELGLQNGFWGSVAAGAVFSGMKIIEGHHKPHEESHTKAIIREAGQTLNEAETLVSLLPEIAKEKIDENWPAAQQKIAEALGAFRSPQITINQQTLQKVCVELRKAVKVWMDLPVGKSIVVNWKVQLKKR